MTGNFDFGSSLSSEGALLLFVSGYLLCLLAPGPNLVVVAGVALTRGFRGVIPISLGVVCGSLALSLAIYCLADLLPDTPTSLAIGRGLGAFLFFYLGWKLIHTPDLKEFSATPPAEFSLGLITACSNPITGAYFAGQFIGGLRDLSPTMTVAIFGSIGTVAFLRCILIGCIFGTLKSRLTALEQGRSISIAIGWIFVAIAIYDAFSAVSGWRVAWPMERIVALLA